MTSFFSINSELRTPAKQEFWWTIGLLFINVFIQSTYAVQICPYVEQLSKVEVVIANTVIALFIFLLKGGLYSNVYSPNIHRFLSRNLLYIDTLLFISGGVLWGMYNFGMNGFPPESGLKIITGFLSIGLLSGTILMLVRKIALLKSDELPPLQLKEKYTPISKDLLTFSITIVIMIATNGILILVKDLQWISTLNKPQLPSATFSVVSEILFIALVYGSFIVAISLLYSSYLKLQLSFQKETFQNVIRGDFQTKGRILSNDEFGVIAQYSNKMIDELRENQELTKSIEYAKRLQEALLPSKSAMVQTLPEHFVFFQPRDIVSGDFYWMETINNKIFFAVGDCTGHGVPGAMVSVVCITALNRSMREFKLDSPGPILDKTRELVISSFQENDTVIRDGMDIALCMIEPKTGTLTYSGAHNDCLLIQNNELITLKACRQPIGYSEHEKRFKEQHVQLNKGDMIYLYSDGFPDQFGGPKGKKFKSVAFKKLLKFVHQDNLEQQHDRLEMVFNDWRGEYDQIDDVSVTGIRF